MRVYALLLFIHGVIPFPSSWEGVTSMGCDVSNRTEKRLANGSLVFQPSSEGIAQLWRTFVWAEFPSRKDEFASGDALGSADSVVAGVWTPRSSYGQHERLPFSVHNPNQRAKALDSCEQWMKAAQEDIKKRPPQKSHATEKTAPDTGTAQGK